MAIELKDRIAIYISLAALFVSIATPIATFYLLDPKIKELRDKHLVFTFEDMSNHWKVKKHKSDAKFSDYYDIKYRVQIKNTGALPIKDVVLSARPR
jgi:hypothetical protein